MPRTITYEGETLTICQWAKRTGITPFNLRYRIDAGWPLDQALHQPLRNCGRPSLVPGRAEQARQLRSASLERAFNKLTCTVDNALKAFREKLEHLLPEDSDPGVGPAA